jgi:hypothetical protein
VNDDNAKYVYRLAKLNKIRRLGLVRSTVNADGSITG